MTAGGPKWSSSWWVLGCKGEKCPTALFLLSLQAPHSFCPQVSISYLAMDWVPLGSTTSLLTHLDFCR